MVKKATRITPQLIEIIKQPVRMVKHINHSSAFQGWKVVTMAPIDSFYRSYFKNINGTLIDQQDNNLSLAIKSHSPLINPFSIVKALLYNAQVGQI